MRYKKIITSGCSFSDPETPFTWPLQLENYINRLYPNVKFDHRGLSSQGQELIQKKAIHAAEQALAEGYDPSEIAVFVMWTSNDRKSFYVDNPDFIDMLVENWKKSIQGWQYQLADLANQLPDKKVITSKGTGYNLIPYNSKGGWLITSCHVADDIPMMRDYFMMSLNANSVSAVNISLENIIFLQSYCKAKGIKLYQQYTIPWMYEDFLGHKNHPAVEYLFKQLDMSNFISEKSMYSFLEGNVECFKGTTHSHPNGLGHRIWLTEVMLPYLEEDGFFL